MTGHKEGIPGSPDRESPFSKLSDEQVVAIRKILGLHIGRYTSEWDIGTKVYRLRPKKGRFGKPEKDVIIRTGGGTDAILTYRRALSTLEAEVVEGLKELDPATLTVEPGYRYRPSLLDRIQGRIYEARVSYTGTSEKVVLERRRARNPAQYTETVRRRLPNLIAERQERARTLGAELRQAYESVVLEH